MDHVKNVTSAPNFCVTIMQELWPVTTSAAAFLAIFLNASKHIHSFFEPSLPHYLPIFLLMTKKCIANAGRCVLLRLTSFLWDMHVYNCSRLRSHKKHHTKKLQWEMRCIFLTAMNGTCVLMSRNYSVSFFLQDLGISFSCKICLNIAHVHFLYIIQ